MFRHSADGINHSLAYGGASPGDALLSDSGSSTLYTPGLMQQDNGAQHFWQLDALGNVRGVTDNGQNPLGEVYYDAFGLPSLRQGAMPGPLGFVGAAGYQSDGDTGLLLLGNRYYAAGIGRFLSEDPSGDGDNWYAYCDNDPLNYIDPEGLEEVPAYTGAPGTSRDGGWGRGGDSTWSPGDTFGDYYVGDDKKWHKGEYVSFSVYRYLFTGNSHASNEVYNAALNQGVIGLRLYQQHFLAANKYGVGLVVGFLGAGRLAGGSSKTLAEKKLMGGLGKVKDISFLFRRNAIKLYPYVGGKSCILGKAMLTESQTLSRLFGTGQSALVVIRLGVGGAAVFETGAAIYAGASSMNQPLAGDGE